MEIETKLKTLEEIYCPMAIKEDLGISDKGSTHSYISEYEKLFAPYREKEITLLEIGANQCHSLKMWREYFPYARIVGNDIWEGSKNYITDENVEVIIADATKLEFLDKIGSMTFDVVIDDGSHVEADQLKTYGLLKDKMNKGSIYVVEDILNYDSTVPKFQTLGFEVIDLRKVKNRFDDILLVKRF